MKVKSRHRRILMETKERHGQHSAAHEAILKAGPRLRPLRQVHTRLLVSGSGSIRSLLAKLLTLAYEAGGSVAYTRRIFNRVPSPDSFLFNSIIKWTSKSKLSLESFLYYRRMISAHVSPSTYTFTSLVKACADLSAVKIGKVLHCHVFICGYGSDVYVQASLVSLYSKSGNMGVARKLFDDMPVKTVVAWNSIISGYEQNGFAKEAIEVFEMMRGAGLEPDSTTVVIVLSACAQLGADGLGHWLHEYVVANGFDVNVVLGTALVNMYTRCGNVRKASEVFDIMEEKNVVAWTAMIAGYGMHGYGCEAVELFNQMKLQGLQPNSITFVAVLSACAHTGLVDEGRQVFASMQQEYNLVPGMEHHVCMVDLLGRAGLLNEAYEYINQTIREEPGPAVWTAMLGACKMHKNYDIGIKVAERLLSIEPENPGHFVMLSNMYAVAGKMDQVEVIRDLMIRNGLKKQVGYSTIDITQKVHMFSMGDKSHPETDEIYQYLDDLMCRCKDAGYVTVGESVMHEVEEEEREFALRYHSEKLAIAYGLLKSSSGVPLRIVKNLRMCEDCHLAIKYISVVANREIIVRDKHRFHHFKDGSCSCLDYW